MKQQSVEVQQEYKQRKEEYAEWKKKWDAKNGDKKKKKKKKKKHRRGSQILVAAPDIRSSNSLNGSGRNNLINRAQHQHVRSVPQQQQFVASHPLIQQRHYRRNNNNNNNRNVIDLVNGPPIPRAGRAHVSVVHPRNNNLINNGNGSFLMMPNANQQNAMQRAINPMIINSINRAIGNNLSNMQQPRQNNNNRRNHPFLPPPS